MLTSCLQAVFPSDDCLGTRLIGKQLEIQLEQIAFESAFVKVQTETRLFVRITRQTPSVSISAAAGLRLEVNVAPEA